MKQRCTHIMMLLLLLLVTALPSYGQDFASHKVIKNQNVSTLEIKTLRTGESEINRRVHERMDSLTKRYKSLVDSLYKYQRPFGWIDIAYTGVATVMRVVKTFHNCSERVVGIADLLNRYHEKCLSRGDIRKEDLYIIELGFQLSDAIESDALGIYESCASLVETTLLKRCTTATMLECLDNVNVMLEKFDHDFYCLYERLYAYIMQRVGWHNVRVLTCRPLSFHANDALERWRSNALRVIHEAQNN